MPASTAAAKRRDRSSRRDAGISSPWKMFLKGFFKNPVMVGAIAPSSNRVINKMLAPVDWDNCKLFVEYGPGVGTFTEHVLRRMAPDATLIAIDTNPDFIRYLRGKFTDSRLFPVTGSATDVRQIIADCGFEEADYVLSGLPFSTLPSGIGPVIAEETFEAIRPGGAFLVYQFSRKAREFMLPHFDRVDPGFEWVNIPPCHMFWGWKD